MERKTINFTIEGKPVAKQSVKFTRSGMRYTPKHIVEYSNLVKSSFMQAYKSFKPLETPLKVRLYVAYEIPKSFSENKRFKALIDEIRPTVKPDCDNVSKNILDSLNGLAWLDDKQIVELSVYKAYEEKPFVDVEIIEV